MSGSVSLTRREQLEGVLNTLIDTTYMRLGVKKKAEMALKASSLWKRREIARAKAEKIVQKINKKIEAAEKEMDAVVKTILGKAPSKKDAENYDPDDDCRQDLSVGVNVAFTKIANPIKPLEITEREGVMVLHFGMNSEWQYSGRHSKHIEKPKSVLKEETIGSPELLTLIADLKTEFTAALSEKDLLAVLIRAKAELGKMK